MRAEGGLGARVAGFPRSGQQLFGPGMVPAQERQTTEHVPAAGTIGAGDDPLREAGRPGHLAGEEEALDGVEQQLLLVGAFGAELRRGEEVSSRRAPRPPGGFVSSEAGEPRRKVSMGAGHAGHAMAQ